MTVRVRFAPSPTGNVHIGNIRAAIFNWLFARHENGQFLLRVEDTDLERSTPEAVAALFNVMDWLKLDIDEDPLYQTSQVENHKAAAEKLQGNNFAYKFSKGGDGEAILFRFPWNAEEILPSIKEDGTVQLDIHPEHPVTISKKGVSWAAVSKKGKAVPQDATLAGFKNMRVLDSEGGSLFNIDDVIDDILEKDKNFELSDGAKISFTRRRIVYTDLVKGELSKPLDSLKDFVIVRSDGSPVFHLANVCDDITQKITHIIRGDDHVENTYKHLFLFAALGAQPPRYGHLPMIVNQQGKPYSKRDGDAYVGDFRAKGFLPEALFNYLSLLGWSPGDEREKMTRQELIEAFTLNRVIQSAAQMDFRKLENLNGQYIAELPFEEFFKEVDDAAKLYPWYSSADQGTFKKVAALMQTRTKLWSDVAGWSYFFTKPEHNEKTIRKVLQKTNVAEALKIITDKLADSEINAETLSDAVSTAAEKLEMKAGKLNQPVRVAATGLPGGADLVETLQLIGRSEVIERLQNTYRKLCK